MTNESEEAGPDGPTEATDGDGDSQGESADRSAGSEDAGDGAAGDGMAGDGRSEDETVGGHRSSEDEGETTTEAEAATEGAERAITSREDVLEERGRELDRRAQRLEERELGLDTRAEDLDERATALDEREADLDARELALESRREEIAQTEERLEQRQAQLDERERELDAYEDELSDRATEISEHEETLHRYIEGQVENLDGVVHEATQSAVETYERNRAPGRFGTAGSIAIGVLGIAIALGGVGYGAAVAFDAATPVSNSEMGDTAVAALAVAVGIAVNLGAVAERL